MLNKKKSGGSYISWSQTLHPEIGRGESSASSTSQHVDRWGVVWAEATLVEPTSSTSSTSNHPKEEESIVVEAVQIDEPIPSSTDAPDSRLGGSIQVNEEHETFSVLTSENGPPTKPYVPLSQQLSHANPLEVLLGSVLALVAVCSVFAVDLSAFIVYVLACAFFHVAEAARQGGPVTWLFYAVFMLVVQILMFTDSILLMVSILISEILAFVAAMLCGVFGGCSRASEWHQYIRRTCHLTRWAFRGVHEGWTPVRTFAQPYWGSQHSEPHVSASNQPQVEGARRCDHVI